LSFAAVFLAHLAGATQRAGSGRFEFETNTTYTFIIEMKGVSLSITVNEGDTEKST
jgi:hypothetical protein